MHISDDICFRFKTVNLMGELKISIFPNIWTIPNKIKIKKKVSDSIDNLIILLTTHERVKNLALSTHIIYICVYKISKNSSINSSILSFY